MQGGVEAEREERERWINKDVKKMMDSVEGKTRTVAFSNLHCLALLA